MEASRSSDAPQTNLTQTTSHSMSSISSSKGKRRAPPPPKVSIKKSSSAIPEEEGENQSQHSSSKAVETVEAADRSTIKPDNTDLPLDSAKESQSVLDSTRDSEESVKDSAASAKNATDSIDSAIESARDSLESTKDSLESPQESLDLDKDSQNLIDSQGSPKDSQDSRKKVKANCVLRDPDGVEEVLLEKLETPKSSTEQTSEGGSSIPSEHTSTETLKDTALETSNDAREEISNDVSREISSDSSKVILKSTVVTSDDTSSEVSEDIIAVTSMDSEETSKQIFRKTSGNDATSGSSLKDTAADPVISTVDESVTNTPDEISEEHHSSKLLVTDVSISTDRSSGTTDVSVKSAETTVVVVETSGKKEALINVDNSVAQPFECVSEGSNTAASATAPQSTLSKATYSQSSTASKRKSFLQNLLQVNVTTDSSNSDKHHETNCTATTPPANIPVKTTARPYSMTADASYSDDLTVNEISSNRLSFDDSDAMNQLSSDRLNGEDVPLSRADDEPVTYFGSNPSISSAEIKYKNSAHNELFSDIPIFNKTATIAVTTDGASIAVTKDGTRKLVADGTICSISTDSGFGSTGRSVGRGIPKSHSNTSSIHNIGEVYDSVFINGEDNNLEIDMNMFEPNTGSLSSLTRDGRVKKPAPLPPPIRLTRSMSEYQEIGGSSKVDVMPRKILSGSATVPVRSSVLTDRRGSSTSWKEQSKNSSKLLNDFKVKLLGKHSVLRTEAVKHSTVLGDLSSHKDISLNFASSSEAEACSDHSLSQQSDNHKEQPEAPEITSWKTADDLRIVADQPGPADKLSSKPSNSNALGAGSGKTSVYSSASSSSLSSNADNEVQTRRLSLSSEASQEFVDSSSEIQRPRRQKKNRSKLPQEFMGQIDPVKESLNDSQKKSTVDSLGDCYTINLTAASDSPSSLRRNSEEVTEGHKNGETCEIDFSEAFDVKGIIRVAEQSSACGPLNNNESVSANVSNTPKFDNSLSSSIQKRDETSLTEAVNSQVKKRIQSDAEVRPHIDLPEVEESSTDTLGQTLQKEKIVYTSKVQVTPGEVGDKTEKKSSKKSISITKINGTVESPIEASSSSLDDLTRHELIQELKTNVITSPVDQEPKILNLKPKSHEPSSHNYNLILSYGNSNPVRTMVTKTHVNRNDSASSYESGGQNSVAQNSTKVVPVKDSRSNTESSYESAPPPIPESKIPILVDSESREFESRSSSVSRQSSCSDNDSCRREFVKPRTPSGPPAPIFSISTYKSRAERLSYDKKLTRSESLLSFSDMLNENHSAAFTDDNMDRTKDDYIPRRLSRSDSGRNEIYRSEEALNSRKFIDSLRFSNSINKDSSRVSKNIIRDSSRVNKNLKTDNSKSNKYNVEDSSKFTHNKSVGSNRKSSDAQHTSKNQPVSQVTKQSQEVLTNDVPDTFHSRCTVFEPKFTTASRFKEPIRFELGSAKDSITFANRPAYSKYSNLRKTKSNFDIRGGGGGASDRMPEGGFTPVGDPLAGEYLRLQDDFMKWQNQLLQNQHVLHSRVAPIATSQPTVNSFGKTVGGLKLGWKAPASSVPKDTGTSGTSQSRKPVEITIPIRMEDTGEIVGTYSAQQVNSVSNQGDQRPKHQVPDVPGQPSQIQFSNPSRIMGPSVQVGAWQERPIEQRMKERSPSTQQQQGYVSSAPTSGPFGRPQFASQPNQTIYEQPSQSRLQYPGSQSGFQQSDFQPPQSSFQQVPQSTFQQAPQSTFQQAPQSTFQQAPQSTFQQAPQSTFQKTPQSTFQQIPQSTYQQIPQSNEFQQHVPQSRFQQAPQQYSYQLQTAPQAVSEEMSQPQHYSQPMDAGSAIKRPQMSYMNGSDRGDDNINARFTSVVTLSNDKNEQNVPQKDRVRSVVQLNNTDSQPRRTPVVKGFDNSVGNNTWTSEKKSPSTPPSGVMTAPVAPVSARLVQQAVQQPGGFRISPPRFERKSQSPPIEESSAQPFGGVTLRHVEPQASPPHPYSTQLVEQPPPPLQASQQYAAPTHIFQQRTSPPRVYQEHPSPSQMPQQRASPQRMSPPRNSIPPPPVAQADVPPPPPPLSAMGVPLPPPPPPGMPDERRTSTGKKIISSNKEPQLDAREELMMAIRQFGGSTNLRKSPVPPALM